MNETKYFLTPNEFSVIAAGFGLSMVYGLKQIDGRLDSKEICVALHNMYINNLIENDNSKQFVADANLTTIMRRIKSAHFMVQTESKIGSHDCTFCLYPGDVCVVVEENAANANKVILYMDEIDRVLNMLVKETSGSPMVVNTMSCANGRVICSERLAEQADGAEKKSLLLKQYEAIMPTED